ncbi:acyl carrier protein [Nostoc sp. 'Peltigera malacea cyanobiont' DB3992]|uniref:acyl carrier protein n=1 Tax=Nostoc sp. 'Peltigera malacea cyanobiont' DB3992 TaxID=1206980 RepID=UPI000C0564BA|nr:acyl carrier protein [Nostoc sp. 'Peltigera malacea cyanobiont' DB3992]PHM11384.1 phosphopantetheine attachment site protein [Nostoc sp. 'Peltigera malacea cyanobiont' DB3992]
MKNIDLIKQETRNVVLTVLPNINSEDLSESSNLFTMGLDSVNAMSLILKLQNNFTIKFAVNDINAENFQSVATIVKLIDKKQG